MSIMSAKTSEILEQLREQARVELPKKIRLWDKLDNVKYVIETEYPTNEPPSSKVYSLHFNLCEMFGLASALLIEIERLEGQIKRLSELKDIGDQIYKITHKLVNRSELSEDELEAYIIALIDLGGYWKATAEMHKHLQVILDTIQNEGAVSAWLDHKV